MLGLLLVALGLIPAWTSAQAASLTWSSPVQIDAHGNAGPLDGDIACPTASQCTAVDGSGREVTFDPGAPSHAAAVQLAAGRSLTSVSCPSVSQCTAVFMPSPRAASWYPSGEITFDPQSGARISFAAVANGLPGPVTRLGVVSCPSTTQCTAAGPSSSSPDSEEVTFDPTDPGTLKEVIIDSYLTAAVAPSGADLALACPSTAECVAVDDVGREITFNPHAPGSPSPTDLGGAHGGLAAVSCSSPTQCVALDTKGDAVVFGPSTPSAGTSTVVDANGFQPRFVNGQVVAEHALACPAQDQCIAVDDQGNVVTFDPGAPGNPMQTSVSATALDAVACPISSQCTAFDAAGVEYTLTPPDAPFAHASLDPATRIGAIACPVLSQCTAVDDLGAQLTLNSSAAATVTRTLIGDAITAPTGPESQSGISCPTARLCIALDAPEPGVVLEFDPTAPSRVTHDTVIPQSTYGVAIEAIACPAATQCTVGDSNGGVVTFNPTSSGTAPATTIAPSGSSLNAIACPAVSQCTALNGGQEMTFDPRAPGSPAAVGLARFYGEPSTIACPSVTQCTAVGTDFGDPTYVPEGEAVTFNPRSPGTPSPVTIDPGQQLTGVACPAVTECVAVDAAGNTIQGDPTGAAAWTVTPIAGAGSFAGVACPVAWKCLAVDDAGQTVFGTSPAPAPVRTGAKPPPPTLGDLRQSHRTWRVRRAPRRVRDRRTPVGTVFSFVVSEPGRITLSFIERSPGRQLGRRCLAVIPRHHGGRRCTRIVVRGTLSAGMRQGHDRLPFSGQLSRTRLLRPGHYTVRITAVNAAGRRSAAHTLAFTIVG